MAPEIAAPTGSDVHDDSTSDAPPTGDAGEQAPLFAARPARPDHASGPAEGAAGPEASTGSRVATSDTTVIDQVGDEPTTDLAEVPPVRQPPTTATSDRGVPAWAKWAAIPVVLLVAFLAWVGWLFADHAGTALPGVTVEGVDASGMDEAAITASLDQIVTSRRVAEVVVAVGAPINSEQVFRLGAEGYEADVAGTVEAALAAGREGLVGSALNHIRAELGQTAWTIPLQGESIDAGVDAFLANISAEVDREPTAGGVTIDPESLEVTAEEPQVGHRAEVNEVRADLEDLAGTGQSASLTIPVTTLDPLVPPENVERVANRARNVLSEAYVLEAGGETLSIDPSEIVGLLSVKRVDEGYALRIDNRGVVAMLEGRGERFHVAPKEASYEVQGGYRTFDDQGSTTYDPSPAQVSVVEGSTGLRYNHEVAAKRLIQLFRNGEHRGEFELDVIEADFTTAEAQAARPDSLLGTFTTYHAAGGNRVFNIHLLADMIDGAMMPPGDDFSVNRDIGDRTEEKGFLPAGAIIDGELVETDIGGGVSQLATTFYNAAFFAGIDLVSWKPHSWPISRYPLAREATFSYAAGLDIHISNNTQGALIVKTSYTNTSITVSIFGQDDGRTVRAEMGQPHDYTDWDVIERGTDELCQGQSRTVQTGAQGFTVDYQRIIEGGTTPGTEGFSWAYSPKDTIIENGTRSC